MLKRVLGAVVIFVMLATMGCANSEETNMGSSSDQKKDTVKSEESQDAQERENKEQTEPVERKKVTVLSWWDITKSDSLQQLKEKFEEMNPDLELEFTMVGSGYSDKVLTMIAGGGDAITAVMMLAMDKVPKFADSGAILPLDDYITDEYMNSLYPVVREACQVDGRVYSVARDVTTVGMYLNTAMFEEAGIDIPSEEWTVDEFVEIAQALTKVDENGKPIQWGYYFPKYADGVYDWLIGFGGSFTNDEANQCMLDSQESKEALQFMYDLIYKYNVVPSESQAKQYGKSAFAPIVANKVAMTMGGLSASNNFINANPQVEYTVLPLPKMNGKSVTHSFVNTWTIPRGAKNPELSWRVMEFFSGKEGQQIVLDTNMGLPASMDVDTTAFVSKREDNQVFIDALGYTVPFETFITGAEFYTLFKEEGERLWLDESTVDEVVERIVNKSQDLF